MRAESAQLAAGVDETGDLDTGHVAQRVEPLRLGDEGRLIVARCQILVRHREWTTKKTSFEKRDVASAVDSSTCVRAVTAATPTAALTARRSDELAWRRAPEPVTRAPRKEGWTTATATAPTAHAFACA